MDVVSTGRRLSGSDAQLLSQFVLIQQVLAEVMDDLHKLSFKAPRRISLRRSFIEPENRAEIEQKIFSNMLYTEVGSFVCSPGFLSHVLY